VAFAVPVDTPGITQICRPNFRYEDDLSFPTPRPKRGHIEALVVFDEVRVPKQRVFLLREWQLAQPVAYAFSAFHRFTAVTYKIPILEYMTGVAMLAAEANGIQRASHIRERFIDMIRYTETTKALAKAALSEPEDFAGSGLYVAKPLLSNMAKMHFASGFHGFVRDIQDVAGGLLVTQPTYRDWKHPELKPYLERYLGGAEPCDAAERLKLFSMLRHLVASDFAGWHEVCTIHAEGSLASHVAEDDAPRRGTDGRVQGLCSGGRGPDRLIGDASDFSAVTTRAALEEDVRQWERRHRYVAGSVHRFRRAEEGSGPRGGENAGWAR
jgi:4-hydroxybutyryl-CoA dehydratase/vinylacetyl-CoA-Delta-isomerase